METTEPTKGTNWAGLDEYYGTPQVPGQKWMKAFKQRIDSGEDGGFPSLIDALDCFGRIAPVLYRLEREVDHIRVTTKNEVTPEVLDNLARANAGFALAQQYVNACIEAERLRSSIAALMDAGVFPA